MPTSDHTKPIDAEDAANIALKAIQDAMGITEGDVAGLYFSDAGPNPKWDEFRDIIEDYMKFEIEFRDLHKD